MGKHELVDIESSEFEKKILEIISKFQKKDAPSLRFIKLPNGWVYDKQTGLKWGPSSSEYMNLAKAKEYCFKNGGRLPTLKELQSLVDYSKHEPAIEKESFPDTKSNWYWTSDITAWNKNAAWCVSFCYGYVIFGSEGSSNYARPVRANEFCVTQNEEN